jgi:D-alanine-D-alanine ligase-like ATP-grasp enzyme
MNKSKNHCYACGNNPISHFSSKMEGLLEAPLSFVHKSLPGRLLERGVDALLNGMIFLARTTGVIRFNSDMNDRVGDRAKVIWEEASRRGIPMRQLVVGKIHTDRYEATVNGKSVYFLGLPIPERLMRKSDAYTWINDKSELKTRLLAEHIPAPQGGKARTLAQALKIFERIRKPVIVKPTNGSRGRHTTTFIYTAEQLREAFRVAGQIAHEMIVEEHLIGSVYRGTVVGGKLVGVLRGDPPRIVGDGARTINELIEEKNRKTIPPIKTFKITPLTAPFLERIGYTLSSVLETGKTIDLTEKVGVSYGGNSAEEFPICHPKTKALLEAAGRIVDLPVMGFDFIIQDIKKDPDEQIWGIIECNAIPFINLHHDPAEGTPINVAKNVWDLWENNGRTA